MCTVCGKSIPVPDPKQPKRHWARQFETDNFLQKYVWSGWMVGWAERRKEKMGQAFFTGPDSEELGQAVRIWARK